MFPIITYYFLMSFLCGMTRNTVLLHRQEHWGQNTYVLMKYLGVSEIESRNSFKCFQLLAGWACQGPDFEILKPCYGVNPSKDKIERRVSDVLNVNREKHSYLYNEFAKKLPHFTLLALPNNILYFVNPQRCSAHMSYRQQECTQTSLHITSSEICPLVIIVHI